MWGVDWCESVYLPRTPVDGECPGEFRRLGDFDSVKVTAYVEFI